MILETGDGGYSIDLDQSDGSAWMAGGKNIWHYSAAGRNLGAYTGFSEGRKWLAVIPGNGR